MGRTCKSIRKEFAKMSEQYTSQLKNEINLYLNNLEMFKNFDYENVQSICRQEVERFQEVLLREVTTARETLDEILKNSDRTKVDFLKVFKEVISKISVEIYPEIKDRLNNNAMIKKANQINTRLTFCWDTGYGFLNYSRLYQVVTLCPSIPILRDKVSLEDAFSEQCKDMHEDFKRLFCDFDMEKCMEQKDPMHQYVTLTLRLDFDFTPLENLIEDYLVDENLMGLKEQNDGEKESIGDPLLHQAWQFVRTRQNVSELILQRHLKIGFNRAAILLDALADIGYVEEFQGTTPRKVLSRENELPVHTNFVPDVSEIKEQCEQLKKDFDNIIEGFYGKTHWDVFLREAFLINLKEYLLEMPQADLPDIVYMLREEELCINADMADMFVRFRNQYRETPEQIMSSNQAYYAQKQVEQAEKAAEEQRILMQRQMEEMTRQTQLMQEEEERRTKQLLSEEERRTQSIVASMERQKSQPSVSESSKPYTPKNGASHPFSWKHDKEYVPGVGYRDMFGNYYNHNGVPMAPPNNK